MGLESQQQLLVTLLVKVGVVASLASILVRSGPFKALLFRERRALAQSVQLGLFLGVTFGLGVAVRVLLKYKAPDLGLEGALLAGLLGGGVAGVVAGTVVALPALLSGEWVALPVLVVVGLLGGVARRLCSEVEEIWHFSPFVDMNIYRWYQRRFGKPRGDWQMMFFLFIVALQAGYLLLGRASEGRLYYLDPANNLLFYLDSANNPLKVAIVLASIACVAIPIKIWNNTRNEIMLEEHRRLLVEARMDALTSQMHPHFLFNALNSISSLVRLNPELARRMIQKLSNILRRLLRRQETFASLGEELSFIDDYLDIEVVRFGAEKLQIVKELDGETLEMQVPSMILQPIVENSIRHGLSPRLAGGVVRIHSTCRDGRLLLAVEDNGVGMRTKAPAQSSDRGIGLSNVQERLRVLYGTDFGFHISSEPGRGTRVEMELPEVAIPATATRSVAQRVG